MAFLKIVILAFFLCVNVQANPFKQMLNRDYADYYNEWHHEFQKFQDLTDMTEALEIIKQIEEVAEITGCREWLLRAEFFKLEYFFITGWLLASENDPEFSKKYTEKAQILLKNVTKAELPRLELLIKSRMAVIYRISLNEFQSAAELLFQIAQQLQTVSIKDVPEKCRYYLQIGNTNLGFRDYKTAITYFNKALESENCEPHFKRHALNGLAVSYRDGYNDYDRSDEYLRAILQINYTGADRERIDGVWEGIIYGNLGRNMFFREEYDNAIEFLKRSVEASIIHNEDGMVTSSAIVLANIYTRTNDLNQAKLYIDLAREFAYKNDPSPRWTWQYYEMMSMYYGALGNFHISRNYMDSSLQTRQRLNERYDALMLLRLEQNEQTLQRERLSKEEERRAHFQRLLLILSVAFVLICGLLIFLFILYRKRNAAYRTLVHKSLQWAQGLSENENNVVAYRLRPINNHAEEQLLSETEELLSNAEVPNKTDLLIMKEIDRLMHEEKIFKDNSLSLDTLAQKLGQKRYIVSIAINKCTKNSFNTIINEHRVKHAIMLLSNKNLSIEWIASDSGFSDRSYFFRVFKKLTGLSPTEFRKNM